METKQREIKFRGQLLEDSKSFKTYKKDTFIYGGYCTQGEDHFIVAHYNTFKVKPETVGQFTGRIDKDGSEIWEGDVYEWQDRNKEFIKGDVWYSEREAAFQLRRFSMGFLDIPTDAFVEGLEFIKKVGNVHEK